MTMSEGDSVPALRLTPLAPAAVRHGRLGRVLWAELSLMLKGLPWWWYTVALLLIGAALLLPGGAVAEVLWPLTWLWPVLLWSGMGARAERAGVAEVLRSTPHPLRRQLPATWLAGVIVALLTGSGFALRLFVEARWEVLPAWLTGALFIPALALALGAWSGSSMLFEVIYALLWYLGPINGVQALDYMGAVPGTAAAGVYGYYLAVTAFLLVMAFAGRWCRLAGR
jgi:hypothetical protein